MSSDKEQNTLELEAENNDMLRRVQRDWFGLLRKVLRVVSLPAVITLLSLGGRFDLTILRAWNGHKSDSTMIQEESEVGIFLYVVGFQLVFLLPFMVLFYIRRDHWNWRQTTAIAGAETIGKVVMFLDVMYLLGAVQTWRVGKLTWAGGISLRGPIILVPLNLGNYYLQRYVKTQYARHASCPIEDSTNGLYKDNQDDVALASGRGE